MTKVVNMSDAMSKALLTSEILEDFHEYVTGDLWTLTASNSGTCVVKDEANGVVTLDGADGSVGDNDESYLHTTKDQFLFAPSKPLDGTFRVQYAEGATNIYNVFVGFSSAALANLLQDNGGGPAATQSGAYFYKVDGGLNWNVGYGLGATQTLVELTAANSHDGNVHVAGSSSFQNLRIISQPISAQKCDFMFYIDGILVYKMKDKDITSAAAMKAVVGVKNGADTTVETIDIDGIFISQTR